MGSSISHPVGCKRALFLRKRALYLDKRGLHVCHLCCDTIRRRVLACKEPYLSAKEPYFSAKEPYFLHVCHLATQEAYIYSTKEPNISAKEPCFSATGPSISTIEAYDVRLLCCNESLTSIVEIERPVAESLTS